MTVLETRPGVGDLLKAWRTKRRLSQFDLSLAADVSTRHLSYVETGKSRPSRDFVLHLAEHLDVPLRGRNDLLVAAGFAPVYGETDLTDPLMGQVSQALDLVLEHQEPYPALVVDRGWDLVRANNGALLLLEDVDPALMPNIMRLTLHPDGLARRILDFEVLAGHLISRLRRQVALTGDDVLAKLVDELATYPGVPAQEPWTEHPGVVLPVRIRTSKGSCPSSRRPRPSARPAT
jgi:transcriptional regulator with XRE-family HTH domain